MILKSRILNIFLLLLLCCWATIGQAQSEIDTPAEHALLYDVQTGKMLLSKNIDGRMYPASMTKTLTAYVVFDLLKKKTIALDQAFKISEKAWRKGGSKMFLLVDKYVTVGDLLKGLIIQSGNDAAIVLAEGIDGSEEAFAARMNRMAKEIGMKNSHFVNPNGWPDDNHYTTAEDLLILTQRLVKDFPRYYKLFQQPQFTYANITQRNRNPLLKLLEGADGVKTGYTEAAGYGLIGSAQRGDRRLIMVLGGLKTNQQRTDESVRIMNWGFNNFKQVSFAPAGKTITTVPVWLGEQNSLDLFSGVNVVQLQNISQLKQLKAVAQIETPVKAPIKKNQAIGAILVDNKKYPLLAKQSIPKVGFWTGAKRKFHFLLTGDYY